MNCNRCKDEKIIVIGLGTLDTPPPSIPCPDCSKENQVRNTAIKISNELWPDKIRGYKLIKKRVEYLKQSDKTGASLSPIDFELIDLYENHIEIELLKCCGNCRNRTGATHCIIYKNSDHPIKCDNWKMKDGNHE